jgi:hypothetical protein
MAQATPIVLQNEKLSLSFDRQGRILSFKNKVIGTEFLSYPGLEDNWRILVLTDGHPVYYILGKEQTPVEIEQAENRVTFRYRNLVRATQTYNIEVSVTAYLEGERASGLGQERPYTPHPRGLVSDPGRLRGLCSGRPEAPRGRCQPHSRGTSCTKGLPDEYLFVVERQPYGYPGMQMQWIDLFW